MLYRRLMFLVLLAPIALFAGCGADTGAAVLDGEVAVDPDVGADVNDIEAMNEMENADPSAPK